MNRRILVLVVGQKASALLRLNQAQACGSLNLHGEALSMKHIR